MTTIAFALEILTMVAKEVIARSHNATVTEAAEIAKAFSEITGSVVSATTKKVTPAEATAQIDALMAEIRGPRGVTDMARAVAEAELEAKFKETP